MLIDSYSFDTRFAHLVSFSVVNAGLHAASDHQESNRRWTRNRESHPSCAAVVVIEL